MASNRPVSGDSTIHDNKCSTTPLKRSTANVQLVETTTDHAQTQRPSTRVGSSVKVITDRWTGATNHTPALWTIIMVMHISTSNISVSLL